MERMLKSFFSIALLASTAAQAANVAPYFSIRSQSENAARELAGWTGHVNLADMDRHYGSFSITPEYASSFRSKNIAEKLFGNDLVNCCKINVTGSDATKVNADKDWLADYLYLPTDHVGNFTVEPKIQNALVDLNLYWGMDEWVNGMFFRIHAPITWTKWDLDTCFKTTTEGTGNGIFGATPLPNANALKATKSFSCDRLDPADVVGSYTTYTYHPLNYSRICPCDETKVRLADIQMDLGWNFLLDDDYHLGVFARAAAPTGNRPKGQLLFEPIVGNGHHWELGGGLTGHAILWRCEENEGKHFGFYADANVTHLFQAKQCRFFDLCNKPWSRYALAFKKPTETTVEVSPVANLTAHEVKVSVGVQADVVAMFNYTSGNFGWDLGYNFWGRSCDKFDKCDTCSDSCCDTTCGTDNCCGSCECPTFFNELDGATWSLAGPGSFPTAPAAPKSYSSATIHAFGDADATRQYINKTDLDYVETKGISHKLFTHFAYNWYDKEDLIPYLGIGGEVEFGPSSDCGDCNDCSTNCSTSCSDSCDSCGCVNTAVSQWGIWVKGGFSF